MSTVKQTVKTTKNKTAKIPRTGVSAIDNAIGSVVDAAMGTSTQVAKKRCPNGEHWNERTQSCEPIGRVVKKLYLGCSRDYVPTEADMPRVAELKIKTAQELRDLVSDLTDMPRGQKNQILGARRTNELINLIVCIETRKKQATMETEPDVEEEATEEEAQLTPIAPSAPPSPEAQVTLPEPPTPTQQDTVETTPMVEIPPEASPEVLGKPPLEKDTKEYNEFLFSKEKAEFDYNKTNVSDAPDLYPTLDDPNFNLKIASRKEFNDTQYEGNIYDIREYSDKLCSAEFEIMPHQLFVKNFLSFQTPYNSLLLYHGLGTGKTCSAIGIAEEMRQFMRQVGMKQRIIVVASPNVQNNFKLQLFDERKLKRDGEFWSLNTCIGSELLREINNTNTKGLTRENIITKIRRTINQYYDFMGYTEFANYIERKISVSETTGYSDKERKQMVVANIRRIFSNRLIIVDEAHNIRASEDNKSRKKITPLLMDIAKYSENMRLLLLSATPMYNSYKEIIWLTNVLNLVDKRSVIREEDVFDKFGNFVPARKTKEGKDLEGGRELLQRKLTGYVSYVRGENPYTFPYRIYPQLFSPENLVDASKYPSMQMNMKPIEEGGAINHVPVFMTQIGEYQQRCYDYIMFNLRANTFKTAKKQGMPSFENMESFGYTILQQPLESLNMVFPSSEFDGLGDVNAGVETEATFEPRSVDIINSMVGKEGLARIMTSKKIEKSADTPYSLRYDFDYRPDILSSFGRIFNRDNIGKYSAKIAKICDCVMNSNGIVMIYSQFIDGGIVPVALALEEMGFTRFGSASHTQSLLKKRSPPIEAVDAVTMKTKTRFFADLEGEDRETFHAAKYVMITGDPFFSANNSEDIKYITDDDNKYGEKVKVVLITKAGAEGLDFKNIRQIHVLDPWYNMNRVEQMIGRGVRNLSHCGLPFEERNVEIYLHGTSPMNQEEPADMYVYRFAEKKAIQIGKITRLLKEIAVDCILHIGQTNFTIEKLNALARNQNIVLNLASRKAVPYKIGDRPFTDLCDYMDNCSFTCSPGGAVGPILQNTYNTDFIKMNYSAIVKRIRQLFREQSFYKRIDLINSINILRTYPVEQIDYALTHFVDNKGEYLTDSLGRTGYLVNRENIYAFQPVEISDEKASIFERTIPVDYKRGSVFLELPTSVKPPAAAPAATQPIPITDTETETQDVTQETPPVAATVDQTVGNLSKIYNETIQQIRANMELAHSRDIILPTKEDKENWYKNVGNVLDKLVDYHKIPLETVSKYVLYHYLDILSFENRFAIVKYLFRNGEPTTNNTSDVEQWILSYFQERIVMNENKSMRGIVLVNGEDMWRIYAQSQTNAMEWKEVETTDYDQFKTDLLSKLVLTDQQRQKYNDLVGFMTLYKERDMVFKTKLLSHSRNNKGLYCEIVGKEDVIKRINSLLGAGGVGVYDEKFITKTITLRKKDEAKGTFTERVVDNGIYKQGLCVILEILLRYYNDTAVNGKTWFLDVEKSKINKFVDYRR